MLSINKNMSLLTLQVTADYDSIYQHSISKPEVFWADRAKEYLHWEQPFDTVMEGDPLGTRWFRGGKINASGNTEKVVLPFQYLYTLFCWESLEFECMNSL